MHQFVQNPTHFSPECALRDGRCSVVQKNFLFFDDGKELTAVDYLQQRCGYVVIMPDTSLDGRALLYHTSCPRMTDVVHQIFPDCLQAPVSLSQAPAEMTLGELQRHRVTLPYADCRARVERFDFQGAS